MVATIKSRIAVSGIDLCRLTMFENTVLSMRASFRFCSRVKPNNVLRSIGLGSYDGSICVWNSIANAKAKNFCYV